MQESDRLSRNQSKMAEMHPAFRARALEVVKELEGAGFRPRIQQAWRSASEQLEAFRNGYSQVMYGFHNVTASNGAKEALAADIIDDDQPLTTKTGFMLRLAAAAEKNGLSTGIRWGLADAKVKAINDALAAQNWTAVVHVGWDPLHVEVTGMTIQDAKSGARPLMPGEQAAANGETTPTETGTATSAAGEPIALPKRRFKVEEVETARVVEYEMGSPLRPASLLSVPYVSQLGAGAAAHANDCGPACAVMLLRAYQKIALTPDEFYTRFGFQGDLYLSVTQLRNAMTSLGLLTDFIANLSIQDVFNALASSKPLIALLSYKTLYLSGLTEKAFLGPHFAVVVGIDCKNIYLHDPLFTDPLVGEAHAYPLDIFWKAWKEVATDPNIPNPERSAIIPSAGIGFQMTRKVKVNTSTLNVRSGPGIGNPVVGTVKKGDILEVAREHQRGQGNDGCQRHLPGAGPRWRTDPQRFPWTALWPNQLRLG